MISWPVHAACKIVPVFLPTTLLFSLSDLPTYIWSA